LLQSTKELAEMIGFSIYAELAGAAIMILLASKMKNRLLAVVGVLFFGCALATLGAVQLRLGTRWLAVLYWTAAAGQTYSAIRTWKRWPTKSDSGLIARNK